MSRAFWKAANGGNDLHLAVVRAGVQVDRSRLGLALDDLPDRGKGGGWATLLDWTSVPLIKKFKLDKATVETERRYDGRGGRFCQLRPLPL